jgi:hypothetical protein
MEGNSSSKSEDITIDFDAGSGCFDHISCVTSNKKHFKFSPGSGQIYFMVEGGDIAEAYHVDRSTGEYSVLIDDKGQKLMFHVRGQCVAGKASP